jgi:hypothetical protein
MTYWKAALSCAASAAVLPAMSALTAPLNETWYASP